MSDRRRRRMHGPRVVCLARAAERAPGVDVARLLLLLATLLLAAAAHANDGFDRPESAPALPETELRSLLGELELARDDRLAAGELLAALEPHGAAAVTALFDALAPGAEHAVELEARRAEELERALRELPVAALGRGATAAELGLAVLEHVGTAAELPLLLELVEPRGEEARLDRALARAFERALSALLVRDAATAALLERRFDATHPALRAPAVRALGAAGTRRALELLGELLGRDAALDQAVLNQVNRLATAVGPPFEWSLVLRIRTYLLASDPALRREAALAAGRMEDVEAFSDVLGLLEDESEGVRESALWTLRRMSGRKLPATAARWHRWYTGELDWWNQEAPALLAAVGMGSESARVKALGELSSHRLFRHELARELRWFLEQGEPELLRLVCSSLASLRSPEPVDELVLLLAREEPEVRRQAWLALRAITGHDLPPEPAAWATLAAR